MTRTLITCGRCGTAYGIDAWRTLDLVGYLEPCIHVLEDEARYEMRTCPCGCSYSVSCDEIAAADDEAVKESLRSMFREATAGWARRAALHAVLADIGMRAYEVTVGGYRRVPEP